MRAFRRNSPDQRRGQIPHGWPFVPDQRALVQVQPAAGVLGGLRVVRHHDHRLAVLPVEHLQQGQDLVRSRAIQVARGLVADEQHGIRHDGPGDGHALFLAAGQLSRLVAGAIVEPHQGQRDGRVPAPLGRRQVRQQERQLHVPLRRQHRQEVIELEHEAHVGGPPPGQRAAGKLVDALAVDRDVARGGRVQPADEVEQGRLARSGWAHQGEEVALGDVQVDAVQDLDPLPPALIGLGHAADLDQVTHQASFRSPAVAGHP